MNLSRLSGRKVCERVKTKGMLWKGKHFFARFIVGLPRGLRDDAPARIEVGTLTSTRLDKSAVKRNRMRRRCREALRVTLKSGQSAAKKNNVLSTSFHFPLSTFHFFPLSTFHFPLSTSYQLLLLPRSSSLSAPFGELLSDADHLLSHLSARARR